MPFILTVLTRSRSFYAVLRHVCDSHAWKTEGNRCYRFFAQDGLSYAQMQVQCNEAGGELARFDNAKQDKVALSLVGKSRAVIGLTDRTKEGKFKWSDGTTPRYTNWAPGEPNDSKNVGGEDCVVMNWYGDKWNDVKCDSNQWSEGFVCSATINARPTGSLLHLARAGCMRAGVCLLMQSILSCWCSQLNMSPCCLPGTHGMQGW